MQGSARVELPDGRRVRLVYDGRNGLPYTSIGRLLIEAGEIAEAEMSLARLKSWLRANGLEPGEPGATLMQRNRSYVFFRLEEGFDPADGPIGGAGVPLTPLRSIAVDRVDLVLRDAVLDRRASCPGGATRDAVSPPDDRAGHRLGDSRGRRAPISSSAAAMRRARAPARSAIPRSFVVLLPRGDEP